MSPRNDFDPAASLDLVFTREMNVSLDRMWAALTQPEELRRWLLASPYEVLECELDLRPGGAFRTVARAPDGREFDRVECFLEVIEKSRLVWTTVLAGHFRPSVHDTFAYTTMISLAATEGGTRFTAVAMHADEAACMHHREMGFDRGWDAALDQLLALGVQD